MERMGKTPFWISATIMVAAATVMGFVLERQQFLPLAGVYALFFLAYVYLVFFQKGRIAFMNLLALGLLLRLILLFAFPWLSDDVYRFIWDGRLAAHGVNPFNQVPSKIMENPAMIPGVDQSLYKRLNSPNYHTVYPPVAQFSFLLAAWLAPGNLWAAAFTMKVFVLGFELGNLWLMGRLLRLFQLPKERVLIYWLNPLVIIEVMGNLHFEGVMIFFLLGAVLLLSLEKRTGAALSMALAIGSKLLPLLFLPYLLRRMAYRHLLGYFAILVAGCLLLFFPMYNAYFVNSFGSSLQLYFQKFEFNASLYYLLRTIGYHWKGYNMIQDFGPQLAFMVFLAIMASAGLEKNPNWAKLPGKMLFAISFYLLCSTTVHPWYALLPLALSLFTTYRFTVVWTGLIFLTYVNYSYTVYKENLWMVGVEYTGVFLYLILVDRGRHV